MPNADLQRSLQYSTHGRPPGPSVTHSPFFSEDSRILQGSLVDRCLLQSVTAGDRSRSHLSSVGLLSPSPSSLPFSWGRRRLRRRRRRRRQGPFAFGTQDRPSAMTSSHHTRARSRPRPPVRDSGEVTPGTAASRLADADGRGTMEIHLGASRRCAQE